MKKLIFSIGGYFSGMVCIVSRYIKKPVPNCNNMEEFLVGRLL